MAESNISFHDPRRRNLVVLGIIAVVMVTLAVWALRREASLVEPKYTPEAFFPHLAAHNREIARIHIDSKKYGAFDIVFEPSKGWVLPDSHDYPANFSAVRETIVGMAGIETIAPQTARADWLHYLDLDSPSKGGKGTEISLLDEHNQKVASMIAGKTKDIGEPGGATGIFVRKPNSTQSWLVRSVFTPKSNPDDWMDKDVIQLDRADIQEVDVSPPGGPSYVVRRDKPGMTDFQLADMPKGRALTYPTAPDGVASSLVDFTFDKVAPASQFDFSNAAELVTRTFAGLTVTARLIHKDDAYWLTLSADAGSDKPAIAKQAREINKHAGGWAFQIPAYKGAQFTTSRESLLKPIESKGRKSNRKK